MNKESQHRSTKWHILIVYNICNYYIKNVHVQKKCSTLQLGYHNYWYLHVSSHSELFQLYRDYQTFYGESKPRYIFCSTVNSLGSQQCLNNCHITVQKSHKILSFYWYILIFGQELPLLHWKTKILKILFSSYLLKIRICGTNKSVV